MATRRYRSEVLNRSVDIVTLDKRWDYMLFWVELSETNPAPPGGTQLLKQAYELAITDKKLTGRHESSTCRKSGTNGKGSLRLPTLKLWSAIFPKT